MSFQNPAVGGTQLLRAAIRSPNYTVGGTEGWTINRDGTAEFRSVNLRGRIVAGAAPGSSVEVGPIDANTAGIALKTNVPNELANLLVSQVLNRGLPNEFIEGLWLGPAYTAEDEFVFLGLNSQQADGGSNANFSLGWATQFAGTKGNIAFGDRNGVTFSVPIKLASNVTTELADPVEDVNDTNVTFTTGATTGAYFDYTDQPTVTMTIPQGGNVEVTAGLTGYNMTNATSSIRCAVALSGATTVNAVNANGACLVTGVAGVAALQTMERTKMFTNLAAGSTTFRLRVLLSAIGVNTAFIDTAWVVVKPLNF